jgi:hypothetical protein
MSVVSAVLQGFFEELVSRLKTPVVHSEDWRNLKQYLN